jgi:predicted secreted protein
MAFQSPRKVKTVGALALSPALASTSLLAAALALMSPLARAGDSTQLQGVVNLSSSASVDVAKDVLSITFGTSREGSDAAALQSQLKQALDAALAEAKKAARPGQVEIQTGNFSLSPRYTNKGVVNGWRGSTELIVEGRDMQAIAQLSGRITTLTINRVGYDLSREQREKSEAEVSGQAISRYRAKAADYAKQFGYAGYTIVEVNVNANEQFPAPPVAMRMKAMVAAPADEALPVEAGKATVTVNVSGTVVMK